MTDDKVVYLKPKRPPGYAPHVLVGIITLAFGCAVVLLLAGVVWAFW